MQATWFVDAPYNNEAGEHYTYGRQSIDYQHLGNWCRSRSGQVIACENLGADWLDFRPFRTINGQRKQSTEVIWTNDGALVEEPTPNHRDGYEAPIEATRLARGGFGLDPAVSYTYSQRTQTARSLVVNSEFVSWARTYSGPKFHGCISDFPYGYFFMSSRWDDPKQATNNQVHNLPSGQRMTTLEKNLSFQQSVRTWGEALLSHLLPGALVFVFAGTRMFEWVSTGMQMAGFEHWETFCWLHAQGFPKCQDIGRMLDKANGNGHEGHQIFGRGKRHSVELIEPSSPEAATWRGYKTASLKPAFEPILCFRAPRNGLTYVELVTEYGTGALNVDGGRIGNGAKKWDTPKGGIWHKSIPGDQRMIDNLLGRFPGNLILDEESAAMLGNVSRYFYCAKASRREREAGLDGWEPQTTDDGRNTRIDNPYQRGKTLRRNDHPTVKPLALCRHLATLLLPPDSVFPRRLMVPFAGSGSEMIGAEQAGWDEVVGIEQNPQYCEIAKLRLQYWRAVSLSSPGRKDAA
jgi:hypothetical protein